MKDRDEMEGKNDRKKKEFGAASIFKSRAASNE